VVLLAAVPSTTTATDTDTTGTTTGIRITKQIAAGGLRPKDGWAARVEIFFQALDRPGSTRQKISRLSPCCSPELIAQS
jgi:hypothetical protein